MQTSILLFCVLSLSLTATAYGGLLVADHPVGQEVNATGDSVTLECSATSVGEISHWLLNGARLDPASMSGVDVSITSGAGGSSTLSISSYQPSNAGEYRCVARSVQQDDDTVEVSHAARVSHFTQRTFTTEPQNFTVYALPPPSGSETGTPSREAAAFNCEFSALPRFGRRPVIVWEIEQASTGVAEVLDLSGSNTRSTFQYDHIGYFQLHTPTEMDDGSRVRCLARHPQDPSQQVESQWATITISNSSLPADFPVFTTQMPAKMYRIDGQQLVMGCSKSKPTAGLDLQWIGTGSTFAFFTAGISLIIIRRDVVPYGHSNVEIPDSSIDDVINETFTCRYTDSSNNEFSWNTTIVEPPPPLPPLIYNDQSSSATLDFGSAGINLVATNYTGRVTWWFNGAPVPTDGSSQKYSITPDMLTLTIRNIVFNDSGLYQAELTDAEPTQFLNYQIDVRGGAAFVLPPPNDQQTVDVDTPSILFDCLTDGNIPPVTNHSWTFNGTPISDNGSKYILYPNGSLAVNDVQPSNAGMYTCTPQNALGSFNSSSVTLIVNGGAAFVLPLPNDQQTVNVGTPSVLFDCLTDGNIPPVTNHSWTFNGTPISHDGSNYILYPNGSLAVNDVQPSNAGMYTCTPQNALGSFNSSSITLIVNGGAAFVLPLPNDQQTVNVGTPSVLFDCLTDGNIPPVTNHSWTFNGTPISDNGSKYILYPNGSLAVNDVQPSNAGMYTCTPQNALGSFNSSSITLIVNGGAAFVLPLPNDQQTVNVGTPSVLFDCLTDGNIPPVTNHSWTFNGTPISDNGSKYILYPNGSLAVNDVQPSNAGMYTCTPQNALGSFNSSSVTLIVNGGAAFVLPLPNDQQTVDVGTPSVLFDCLTDGNIPPVTNHSWTFNGTPITHNGSKYILCPNGSLAVNDIQPSDAGMYTCTPQNTLGSFNSSSVTLIVNAPPGAPRISYVAIVEETSIFVNWTALDDVKTYILEIRTSHEEDKDSDDQDDSDDHDDANDSNDRENVKSLVLDTNTYIIPNADFDVIYHFRVKATNDFGSSDFSAAYKFDPESAEESGHGKRRAGLRGWEIVLIVIFIILILLLCCIFFICVFICWRRENRTYYAAKKEKEMQDSGVEAYRQTGEPDNKDE